MTRWQVRARPRREYRPPRGPPPDRLRTSLRRAARTRPPPRTRGARGQMDTYLKVVVVTSVVVSDVGIVF